MCVGSRGIGGLEYRLEDAQTQSRYLALSIAISAVMCHKTVLEVMGTQFYLEDL